MRKVRGAVVAVRRRHGHGDGDGHGDGRRHGHGDGGIVTSEYAMGLIAAVGFAGVLYKVVTSAQVSAALQGVVQKALDVQF
ncbi:DUF4244 domain-containing protein [Streptomyces uncialis]|uniref:DUF4244 domain-containing protein n=1 Tax=Streptomyces uncialis TaxID=1048205 RepID=UPI002E2F4064|nr:DUF4244 domain-containing protein [Streptomyces uncialis]WTE11679.1 DUF4244 domain-containing protein [Streptomyces uncialis]